MVLKNRAGIQALFIAGILAGIVACGDSKSRLSALQTDPDQVPYDLNLSVDSQSLTSAEAALLEQVNSGRSVSFKSVTDLAAQSQENASGDPLKRNLARERILSITPSDLASLGAADIKLRIEEGLQNIFAEPLKYNSEKNTIVDVLAENRMQSDSGTALFHMIARQMGGAAYRAKNFVTIFTDGHVQPGYMKPNGGNFQLIGIETTALGPAEVDYGAAKNLRGEIVVVDADHNQLAEIFLSRLKNRCAVQDKIVDLTAQKYGIRNPQGHCADSLVKRQERNSLFRFGSEISPPGDLERNSVPAMQDLSARYSSRDAAETAPSLARLQALKPALAAKSAKPGRATEIRPNGESDTEAKEAVLESELQPNTSWTLKISPKNFVHWIEYLEQNFDGAAPSEYRLSLDESANNCYLHIRGIDPAEIVAELSRAFEDDEARLPLALRSVARTRSAAAGKGHPVPDLVQSLEWALASRLDLADALVVKCNRDHASGALHLPNSLVSLR